MKVPEEDHALVLPDSGSIYAYVLAASHRRMPYWHCTDGRTMPSMRGEESLSGEEGRLIQVCKRVWTRYRCTSSVAEAVRVVEEEVAEEENDYVEGILYHKDHGVVITATLTHESPATAIAYIKIKHVLAKSPFHRHPRYAACGPISFSRHMAPGHPYTGKGRLDKLPAKLILDIINYLNIGSLLKLAETSRTCVRNIYTINATGQLLPFIIGLVDLGKCIYKPVVEKGREVLRQLLVQGSKGLS
ncbi:hypothetical protein GE09DRAFT_1067788 [Coniochaeta sp. 2T2.1]|nr:hypothetical protein GE09DRAFT_1067788 [Coniochaeta sp. 2T2.1]